MATAQLIRPVEAPSGARAGTTASATRAPAALGGALVALVLYAAFAHGAAGGAAEARLQVAIPIVAALAAAAWLWSGTLRLAAPRMAVAGIALLTIFAAWSGLSVMWSVAPDQ